ncbi:hypothetical protein [Flavivirga eckloniae]|uniref:Uncharacterized protein n=1 Tax=Flavivirga eckloniae TaxID=1803846 RepID=A0A2K9PWG0_9FLAO|nr:hypothetical protein [Flavivirga eckloniae]AUP81394.1 hypothetical protein C1H87_22815 [Flavivirga eckloniae]
MNILIFKTNINTQKKLATVEKSFIKIPGINRWTVDMEDIDKVLRIEAHSEVIEANIIDLLQEINVYCQNLKK